MSEAEFNRLAKEGYNRVPVVLETFADHESRSVQHTAYAMGEAVLERCPEIDAVAFIPD